MLQPKTTLWPDEPFDLQTITPQTRPTAAEVVEMLRKGELRREPNSEGTDALLMQYRRSMVRAAMVMGAFQRAELDVTPRLLVIGLRLFEVLAGAEADRITARVHVAQETRSQAQIRESIAMALDDVHRLARDRKVDLGLFKVTIARAGADADRILRGARLLKAQLHEHGHRLEAPKVVERITCQLADDIKTLDESEMAQETGKLDRTIPTNEIIAAREALYAILLKISRLGPVAVGDQGQAAREEFRLTGLFSSRRASRSGSEPADVEESDEGVEESESDVASA